VIVVVICLELGHEERFAPRICRSEIPMRFIPVILVTTLAVSGSLQTASAQQPMPKGSWTYKDGKPETVNFDYGTELTAEDIARLSTFVSIAQVYMGFAGVDSEYVTVEGNLLALGRLKNLELVYLNKDGIVDEDLKFIASLPKIRAIEFNAINGKGGCTNRCADHLSNARTLRELRIYNGQFKDKFIDKITMGMPNLEQLMLSSPELTDESLRLIAERCKNLKSLSIGSDHFTAEGLKHLDKLSNLKRRRVSSPALRERRHELKESKQTADNNRMHRSCGGQRILNSTSTPVAR
jgi:hypothetical protein